MQLICLCFILSTRSTSFTFLFLLYCHTILSWSLCRLLCISSTVACPTLSLFIASFSVRSWYFLVLHLNFVSNLSRLLYLHLLHHSSFNLLPIFIVLSLLYFLFTAFKLRSAPVSPAPILPLESFSFLLSFPSVWASLCFSLPSPISLRSLFFLTASSCTVFGH